MSDNKTSTWVALNICLAIVVLVATVADADVILQQKYESQYPASKYYVGVGEIRSTGSRLKDYRVAEVMARRDIAQQIKVNVTSVELDFACGGPVGDAYPDKGECRDEYISIIQSSTNEFLSGSRIVDKGVDGDHVFVVVVMPRADMADRARESRDEAISEVRESVDKAKAGDKSAQDDARDALLRAKALDLQARSIADVRESSVDLFKELDSELGKL